jgi:hypothetical protein
MKLIAIAALAASTLCFAQTPAPPKPVDPTAIPTVAEIEQQIKTLIATRQVYYERLDKITEFQNYTQANEQIGELQKQERQIIASQRPGNTSMSKAEQKQAEDDFKKKMADAVEREKRADKK